VSGEQSSVEVGFGVTAFERKTTVHKLLADGEGLFCISNNP
jgi:hypothetical protein